MLFTDNPLEREMKKVPRGFEEPILSPPQPCRDCSYYKGTPCMGICWRDLLRNK